MGAEIPTRETLIGHLKEAAEAEHSLCCQYLYAAFSLRRVATDYPADLPKDSVALLMADTQHWATQIFYVARQEMEHLAIVTNCLAALGERPHFSHGNFPDQRLSELLGSPMELARCDETAIARFQHIERPPGLDSGPPPPLVNIYDAIKSLFATLPAKQLFRASTGRQVSSSSVMLGVAMKIPAITDRLSAASAIDQLLAEGEGLGDTPKAERATHFARFSEVRREWSKAAARHGFAPCLPVVSNPVSGASEGGAPFGSTVVTNPFSVAVMDLFRDGYRLTLLMLKEFFWGFRWGAGPFEVVEALKTPGQRSADLRVTILSENSFFPLMTMFIRPVGELLARLPAFDEADPRRAGASFDTGPSVPVVTDISAYIESLGRLSERSAALAREAPDTVASAALSYLHQNLHRMRMNVASVWHHPR